MRLPRNILVKKSLLAGRTCTRPRLLECAIKRKGMENKLDMRKKKMHFSYNDSK